MSVEFTKAGLDRLHRVLSGHVERQFVPGLVALVARGNETHVEALGTMAVGSTQPMRRDTIFRIASITKPIVAAAAMVLVEECRIRLDDPIDRWLPELANRRVLKSLASPIDDTVPARSPIALRHLLTSTMGLGSIMAMPGTYPIQNCIRDYGLGGDGPMMQGQYPTTDEWLAKLGSLPLVAHPGEQWLYHNSLDALGVLIARVSGKTLGTFLRERLFEPLGMKDTAFQLPADKIERLPAFYSFNRDTNRLEPFDDPTDSDWTHEPHFESGGGGLVSTADDYLAFSRMLLNKGRHGREQILARPTVEMMTSDHLTPDQRRGTEIFLGTHSGWGFGMAVAIHREEIYQTPGRFGWDGGFGTSAYTDPGEGVIGILLTQRLVDSPEPSQIYTDFWTTTYAALA